MRQFAYLICCGLVYFLLSGFDSGIEAEKLKNNRAKSSEPILEYQEPEVSRESNQDLFHEYHLLVVTSLEEASSALTEDAFWSFSMAQNAYHFIELIKKLLKEEYKDAFVVINKDLYALMIDMRKHNLSNTSRKKLAKELNSLADDLEDNFCFKKVELWIAN